MDRYVEIERQKDRQREREREREREIDRQAYVLTDTHTGVTTSRSAAEIMAMGAHMAIADFEDQVLLYQ